MLVFSSSQPPLACYLPDILCIMLQSYMWYQWYALALDRAQTAMVVVMEMCFTFLNLVRQGYCSQSVLQLVNLAANSKLRHGSFLKTFFPLLIRKKRSRVVYSHPGERSSEPRFPISRFHALLLPYREHDHSHQDHISVILLSYAIDQTLYKTHHGDLRWSLLRSHAPSGIHTQ